VLRATLVVGFWFVAWHAARAAEGVSGSAELIWPMLQWSRAEPAQVGMDAAKVAQASDHALTGGGSGYITRHGRLVMAWGDPRARYDLKSTTKSFGSIAVGLAIKDGKLRLEDKAVIKEIVWAPPETIVRRAKGSDNWPMTWADDGWLYTAYGDGNGFEPRLKEKLSLGLARVRGNPPEVVAENLRAPTLEQKGDGARGKKASGLLMVDGVLYLWARNAGNAQLAWSADHGATWTWADWKLTTSFGCPTFLNFGRNYDGARDEFVYVYSHDADSAYQRADRMVLARAPKHRLREESDWEFFQELDAQGRPVWTKDVTRRGAVLTSPGRCYRSSVSYNAGLKRYLWVQTGLGEDTRFGGGLAIYDAPEPWGPWTTVFATDAWDVGPGETASFPTKWISPDGCTLYLVFSGDDGFSIRQATLKLR